MVITGSAIKNYPNTLIDFKLKHLLPQSKMRRITQRHDDHSLKIESSTSLTVFTVMSLDPNTFTRIKPEQMEKQLCSSMVVETLF
jgi:hypothetical protein